MNDMTVETVEKLLETGRISVPPLTHPQGGLSVPLPAGWIAHHLQPLEKALPRIVQRVTVLDAASFVAYVNRFKGAGDKTTIFADYQKPVVEALIDYHDKEKADYLAHRVSFCPPWSEQWARWRSADTKTFSQLDFAEFIEENLADIVEPAGGVFLDLVTGLNAKKKVTFQSGVRLQDGTNQLIFEEEIEAKGKGHMAVPAEFSIGVPIFYGGSAYKVRAFLRYRINEGKLSFAIKINRRLFVEQTAFNDITAEIGAKTELVVLNGSP